MKYIISENKLNDVIKKFILSNYPMINDVHITYDDSKPTKIVVDFIDGQMTHSPSYLSTKIKHHLINIFNIDCFGKNPDCHITYKMVRKNN